MKAHQLNVPINGRVRAVLQFLRDQNIKNKVVVDVGSTFGWLAKEIEKDNLKKYIGVEPNQESVDYAKKNVKYAEFFQGFAEALPIKDSAADIVVFFDVIEHVQDEQKSLNEIARVLKKDGVLLLTTPYDHPITKLIDPAWYFGHRHYSKSKLYKMLKKAGLQVESFEVRGGIISLIYMLWFYFNKWIFRGKLKSKFLEKLDDVSYENNGIATVFLTARK
jgi:ubiquinone/menaquinone biosynthesis C-methylase UbiE